MIGFNHVLSGALVAVLTPPQYIIYIPIIAFVLHFILDTFPHYGRDDTAEVHSKKFNKILVVDGVMCILALALALYLYPDKLILIALGVFFAVLPDILWIFHYYIKINHRIAKAFFRFAEKIQWGERPWAWSLEILYCMIFLTLLIGLS